MYTPQITLLSSKGIIANAIVDLLPDAYGVQLIYFSDEEVSTIIQQEADVLLKSDIIILNLSEMHVDAAASISLLKRLYKQSAVLVLHLYNQKTFADAFIKMGADAYLPVNFNQEELLSVIESVLKKKERRTIKAQL